MDWRQEFALLVSPTQTVPPTLHEGIRERCFYKITDENQPVWLNGALLLTDFGVFSKTSSTFRRRFMRNHTCKLVFFNNAVFSRLTSCDQRAWKLPLWLQLQQRMHFLVVVFLTWYVARSAAGVDVVQPACTTHSHEYRNNRMHTGVTVE